MFRSGWQKDRSEHDSCQDWSLASVRRSDSLSHRSGHGRPGRRSDCPAQAFEPWSQPAGARQRYRHLTTDKSETTIGTSGPPGSALRFGADAHTEMAQLGSTASGHDRRVGSD
jgi:hypothetical protein